MDQETKDLLKKDLEVSEKSLEILKKIHKDILWRRIIGLIKFGIVIGLFIWSYFALEPVLQDLLTTYKSLLGSGQIDLNSLPPEVRNLIQNLLNKK